MASIELDAVSKRFGAVEVIADLSLKIHRRIRRLPGAVGLREVDAAAHDRGAGDGQRRRDPDRRRTRRHPAAGGARGRHGVPALRALPAHDRHREHGLRPQEHRRVQGRDRPQNRRGGAHPGDRPAPRPQARPAFRRPEAARRHRPAPREEPEGLSLRRAALQPRRGAAGAHPRRARPSPPAGPRHHDLRHPRSGRGDDARRPHRRDERAQGRAGRHPMEIYGRPAPSSSPAVSVRPP